MAYEVLLALQYQCTAPLLFCKAFQSLICANAGGVEYGFMSTTLDRTIAAKYSKGNAENPSLILEMEMGMVNRGALLSWLSQYPNEAEILLPPLTGLEVSSYSEAEDQTLVYKMQLNINMQSMTIEQVCENVVA